MHARRQRVAHTSRGCYPSMRGESEDAMSLSRREFLRRTGAALATFSAVAIAGCEQKLQSEGAGNSPKTPENQPLPQKSDSPVPQKKGTIIGAMKRQDEAGATVFGLALLNLDAPAPKAKVAKLTFLAHGVSPNPAKQERAVLFEKQGPGCCEIDFKTGKVLNTITTDKGRKFYGHGVWSLDGGKLYCTETEMDTYKGVVVVRDGATFKELGKFPTFGEAPHDMHMIDGGKTLVITNGGAALGATGEQAAPCVTFVDIASEKLLERVTFPNERLNAGHLAITSAKDLAIVSAPRDGVPDQASAQGGITLRPKDGKTLTMADPAEITAETLSVAIHESTGTVAATNPTGNILTFWNLKQQRFIRSVEMTRPLGVTLTLDGKEFCVSYVPGGNPALQRFDAATLEPIAGSVVEGSFMTGSHIIAYDL
jgi:hypothetical protein